MPSGEIAKHLDRSNHTIKGYLSNCGGVIDGTYYLNALAARALFSEEELMDMGATWNGRCWVGPGRIASEL